MRRIHGRSRSGAAILAVLVVATGTSSASRAASPAVIAWSTYLRAGPGETYAAIFELEHDTHVQVAGCSDRWCRVSGPANQGYVDREALDLPRTRAPEPSANADCVIVGQKGGRGPEPTRFCTAPPSGR